MTGFKARQQVVYVPNHVQIEFQTMGDAVASKHKDLEYGFVTGVKESAVIGVTVFCRFWSKWRPSIRTTSCSEGCNQNDLYPLRYTDDKMIDAVISAYEIQTEDDF